MTETEPLLLYNTLKREKQVFVPQDPDRVTLYVCGPTVYSYAHIGNARPAVIFDLLHQQRVTAGGERSLLENLLTVNNLNDAPTVIATTMPANSDITMNPIL